MSKIRDNIRNNMYEQLLAYIIQESVTNEIPPSVREIVNEFDLCSTSTAIYWLKKMTGAGLLRREPGAIRGIFVTLEGYKIARISAASRKKLLNKVAIQFAMLSNAMVPTTIVFEGKTLEMSFKEIGNDHSPE